MKPNCLEDPFRAQSGIALVRYWFTKEVPREKQGQWFPLEKSAEYISAVCRADGTLRQMIRVQEGGAVHVSVWDVRNHFVAVATYKSPFGCTGWSLIEGEPEQIIARDNAQTDIVVDFAATVGAYFRSELEWTGNPNPFCTVRETAEFRNVDI